MKTILFKVLIISFLAASCNGGVDLREKTKQDSLAQVATADSMLKAAMARDSLALDSTTVDSAQ